MKAKIYTRVSTRAQEDNYSPARQEAECRAYAERIGAQVVGVVRDVCSGATLERPGLLSIRDSASAGEFDVLIIATADRLARRMIYSGLLHEELNDAGVTVHYSDTGPVRLDDPESELSGSIRAVVAQYERDRITRRMAAGKRQKIESGQIGGHGSDAPYGYRFSGYKRERRIEIDEHEAPIVRDIYGWYLEGVAVREIARCLTATKVPLPGDSRTIGKTGAIAGHNIKRGPRGTWASGTIYRILRHPIYKGDFAHNRVRDGSYRTDPSTWMIVRVPEIVSPETWEAAQARLAQGRLASARKTRREYLLRTRARCACGYATSGTPGNTRLYYTCSSRRSDQQRCDHPYYRADLVDLAVWTWVENLLQDEAHLREGLEAHQAGAQGERQRLLAERERYQARLDECGAQVARLVQAVAAGALAASDVASERQRIDLAGRELSAEVARLDGELSGLGMTEDQMTDLHAWAAAIRTQIDGGIGFETRRRIIALLDVRVVLEWRDGQTVVHATCALGGASVSESTFCTNTASHLSATRAIK